MSEKAERIRKTSKEEAAGHDSADFTAYAPVVAAWLMPGGGHFWLRQWGRGALLLASVAVMFFLGLGMRGKIYRPNPGDIVDTLAWLADIGAGGLYLAARFFGYDVPEPPTAVSDYGTKFLLVAGLLNMLVMLDAFDIASGKKS